MRASLRTIKRSLPDPWQRVIEWLHRMPERLKPQQIMRENFPKWDYLCWLMSSEAPTDTRLHRANVRVGLTRKSFRIPPSQRVKERAIRAYARRHGLRTFVETGTFRGDTVAAMAEAFDRRITIELSTELWREANKRLPGVECLLGDSGAVLKRIVPLLKNPALFWLDAHASGGDTIDSGVGPIFEELQTIFASGKPHVILIDDARGHQVEAIKAAVPDSHSFSVRNDIIRITPRHFP